MYGNTAHPDYATLSSYHLVIASGLDETTNYLELMPRIPIAKYRPIVAQYGSSLEIVGLTSAPEHGRTTSEICGQMHVWSRTTNGMFYTSFPFSNAFGAAPVRREPNLILIPNFTNPPEDVGPDPTGMRPGLVGHPRPRGYVEVDVSNRNGREAREQFRVYFLNANVRFVLSVKFYMDPQIAVAVLWQRPDAADAPPVLAEAWDFGLNPITGNAVALGHYSASWSAVGTNLLPEVPVAAWRRRVPPQSQAPPLPFRDPVTEAINPFAPVDVTVTIPPAVICFNVATRAGAPYVAPNPLTINLAEVLAVYLLM